MVQYYEWDAEEAKTGTRLKTDGNGDSKVETYEETPAKEAGNDHYVAINSKSLKVWEGKKSDDK